MGEKNCALAEARLLREGHQLLEARRQQVPGGHQGGELPYPGRLQEQLLPPGSRIDLRLRGQGLQVPLVEKGARQAPQGAALVVGTQALERDAAVESVHQRRVARHQALGQPGLPGLGEEKVRLRLIGYAEAGKEAAVQRTLLEEGVTEGVDGGDGSPLQHIQRLRRPRPGGRGEVAHARPLQPLPQPQLHGGGRVLGEGDGRDLGQEGRARAHQRLHAVHEEGGLARARPRLHHQAGGEITPGARAGFVVDGPEAHPMSLRRRMRMSWGSLPLIWRRRSRSGRGPQTAVKSHQGHALGSWMKRPWPMASTSPPRRARKPSLRTTSGSTPTCRPPST